MMVVSAACMELSDAPASTQKKMMVHSVCICEEIISEVPPTSAPATIHGVRLPKRRAGAIGQRAGDRRDGRAEDRSDGKQDGEVAFLVRRIESLHLIR